MAQAGRRFAGLRPLVLILLLAIGAAAKADTFRWTDDRGAIHYSDQVPPEHLKHRRSKLDHRGLEVGVIETPKTPEQLERERLLKHLRSNMEKILSEQQEIDRALLRTYRNADEILSLLKSKLDTLDRTLVMIAATHKRESEQLEVQKKRIGDLKARGKPVQSVLLDSLASSETRINHYKNQIMRFENEKLATTEQFNRDLRRFLALKAVQKNHEDERDWSQAIAKANSDPTSDLIISAVNCDDMVLCDRYWKLAKRYITENTGYRISVETEKLIQTPYPRNETDFGIIITRIPGTSHDILFLDIVCRPTTAGEQLCRGEWIQGFRARFIPTLKERAARESAHHGLPPEPSPERVSDPG